MAYYPVPLLCWAAAVYCCSLAFEMLSTNTDKMKPIVVSVEQNLCFSGVKSSYMYMLRLLVSDQQAVCKKINVHDLYNCALVTCSLSMAH
jgi:hypothetical protein